MSYIRCLSNPEGLYIIFDGTNIEIMRGTDPIRLIPQTTWEKLIRRYNREEYDEGATEEETFTEDGYSLIYRHYPGGKDWKWVLSSPKKPKKVGVDKEHFYWDSVEMWDVTWHYIAHDCEIMEEHRKEIRKEQRELNAKAKEAAKKVKKLLYMKRRKK